MMEVLVTKLFRVPNSISEQNKDLGKDLIQKLAYNDGLGFLGGFLSRKKK